MPIVDAIAGLRRILAQARPSAVTGLSANWYRPSYFAAKHRQDHGYRCNDDILWDIDQALTKATT